MSIGVPSRGAWSCGFNSISTRNFDNAYRRGCYDLVRDVSKDVRWYILIVTGALDRPPCHAHDYSTVVEESDCEHNRYCCVTSEFLNGSRVLVLIESEICVFCTWLSILVEGHSARQHFAQARESLGVCIEQSFEPIVLLQSSLRECMLML